MYIHTCHNFLITDISEFLWSMAVRGRVLPCVTSVFKATRYGLSLRARVTTRLYCSRELFPIPARLRSLYLYHLCMVMLSFNFMVEGIGKGLATLEMPWLRNCGLN